MSDQDSRVSQLITQQMTEVDVIFQQSTPLKTASSILFGAVVDSGLADENEEAEMFAKDAVQKLFLYGFFVFAVSRKRKTDDSFSFVNIDHRKITLDYDFKKAVWYPKLRGKEELEHSGRVRMIMWKAPTVEFGLDSPAFNAQVPAQRLEEVYENIRRRDEQNSSRAVYTALSEMETTSSGQPWFAGASAVGYTGAYGFNNSELDIDELIENRQTAHEKLHELSMSLRARSFGSEPAGAGFVSLQSSLAKEHNELMVDAGSKAVFQAHHLAGENDNMRLVRTLQIDLFIACGVPPQAAGINSNTERVAGSERITSVALDSFFNSTAKIRQLLNGTCEEIFQTTFKEGIDVAKMTKVLPILKVEPAKELLTVAYKLNEEDIDMERLQVMQDALLYGQSSGLAPKNEGNQNAAKDEEQKQEDADKRFERKVDKPGPVEP